MNIEEFLRGLLDRMLFENYGIEYEDDGRYITIRISLPEDESGILIGRHGETLSSLRKLLHTVFIDEVGEKRIILHINDYRNQREEKIRQLVDRGVERIQRTGRPYRLYRLNAAERFFAHNLIASEEQYQGYSSHSVDDEDGDRVLIIEEAMDDYTDETGNYDDDSNFDNTDNSEDTVADWDDSYDRDDDQV